jgi:hypothetical protein
MDKPTYHLYTCIIKARKADPEKLNVQWPSDHIGPQNRSKRKSALVEAKKYTMFGDNKLYYNLNNGTEKPEGTKKLSASRSVLTFVTRVARSTQRRRS